LVVAGDEDEGLLRVLLGEVDGHLDGVGEGHGVVDGGGGAVGVAGPVYLAALAHHEEAGVVHEHVDALLNVVGQGPHVVGAVYLIGHGVAVGEVLVYQNHLVVGGDGVVGGVVHADGVAGLLGEVVEVVALAAVVGVEQSA